MGAQFPGGGGGGAPSGPAGGVLSGSYPNPGFGVDMATQAELDAVAAAKASLASPALTGNPTAPTQTAGNNSTRVATTAYADGAVAMETTRASTAEGLLAPKVSPAFTGVPAAPTAAVDTNTTQVATTAFVVAQAGVSTPAMDSAGAVGTSKRYARDDHVHPSDATRLKKGGRLVDLAEPFYIPHRGAGQNLAPQNTIEAMRIGAAFSPIIDGGDLRMLPDGGLMNMHDTEMSDLTTRSGSVALLGSTQEFKRLTLDSDRWLRGGWGNLVPITFDQIAREFGGRVVITPEYKTDGITASNAGADALAAAINRYDIADSVIAQSFVQSYIARIVAATGCAGCFLTSDGTGATAASLLGQGIRYIGCGSATPNATITALIAAGMKVLIFTPTRQNTRANWIGLGVSGFWTDEPLYFPGDATKYRLTSDPFAGQTWPHGMLAHSDALTDRGAFISPNRWGFTTASGPTFNTFVLQGWGCPLVNAASTYSITFTVTFDTIGTDTTRWAAIAACCPNDAPFIDDGSAGTNGYNILFRTTGAIGLNKRTNGALTSGPTGTTTAVTVGNSATLRLDVTPTTVALTRTDVGPTTVSWADTGFRGGYFHFGKNANTGSDSGMRCSFSAVTIA